MFGLIIDFFVATEIELPFKLAWKRTRHVRNGHEFEGSVRIDKITSEHHPHTDKDYIYTINLRECECGLIFQDKGVERRNGKKTR